MRGPAAILLALGAVAACSAMISCGGRSDREEAACSLLTKSAVTDALRSAGSEVRSLRRSSTDSLHLSACRFTGRGVDVRLTVDTAPGVSRRYFNRLTEQQTFNVHSPDQRPRPIEDLGEDDAYGPAGAYWIEAQRQLFALNGERLLIIGFAVPAVGGRDARLAAERLARAALGKPRPASGSPANGKPPSERLELSITAPIDGEVVRGRRVTVHGTITGRDARVRVAGRPASVRNGIFARTVSLERGVNVISVVSFAEPGQRSSKTIRVRRGRSPRQIGEALARRRPRVVPDLLGERLDVAEKILRYAGLSFRRVKVAASKVVPRAWAVCLTRPPPGTRLRRHREVVLLIDLADIYRVSGTACARE